MSLAVGSSPSEGNRGHEPAHGWTVDELRRPAGLLAAIGGLSISLAVSFNLSCQAHEFGHALVGSVLGWRVDRVNLCLPAGGSVRYAATPGPAWINTAESFAGGSIAAVFLAMVYVVVFHRRARPPRHPPWWGAGFGPVLLIGPQLVVSVAEGTNPDRNYGEVLNANLPVVLPIIAALMLAGASGHVWLWRSVWRLSR